MFGVDEKLTSRVFRLYSHKLHKKRLNDIKSKLSTRINNSVPRTLKYQQIKRTGYMSQLKERTTSINRENEKIFQMITQISGGKRGSSIQYIIETTRASPKPRSLNLPTRKKEAQRIIEDNYALAKRLSESTRGVSFKKFDEDWQHTTRYLNSISKRNFRKLPKIDEVGKHLPGFANSEIGSKKLLTIKSPLGHMDIPKSNFSQSLISPLPGSVIEKPKEEDAKESKEKNDGKITENKKTVKENKEIVKESKEIVKESKEIVKESKEIVKENKEIVKENKEIVKENKEIVKENKEIVRENKEIVKENKEIVEENKELEKNNESNIKKSSELLLSDKENTMKAPEDPTVENPDENPKVNNETTEQKLPQTKSKELLDEDNKLPESENLPPEDSNNDLFN